MGIIKSLLRWMFAIGFGGVAIQVMATQSFIGGCFILAGAILLSPPGGAAGAEAVTWLRSGRAQVVSALIIIFVAFGAADPTPSRESAGVATLRSSPAFACESGAPADGAVVQVIGADSHNLRRKPEGDRILNEKATSIIGSPVYQSIDNSTKVQVQCIDGSWARVQITSPEWLKQQGGWVKVTALAMETAGGGQRQFTENDFYWDADTKKAKALIVKTVNRIQQEDTRCKDSIYPGSVAKSPSQTKSASNPVFFVTCGDGASAVNVYFDAARANDPTPFTPPIHLPRANAIQLCESHAKSQANHPSTVSFSRIMDMAITEHPNGRTTVISTFTAKNGFNMVLKYQIRCLLDENGFIEAAINEAM